MPYSIAAKAAMLDHLGTLGGWVSLHSADPGTTGTGELTGGSPAYARKAVTWLAASAAEKRASSQPVFDVPAGVSVTHGGVWSAATGGTYYGSGPIPNEAFSSQGTYTLTESVLDLLSA